MKSIPEVQFRSEKTTQVNDFEFVALEDLMSAIAKPRDHNPYQPHRLGFFVILIITEGEVNHIVDFKIHTLRAGDVMVMSKGQIHAFDEFSKYKGYLVLFTEAFMQKYMAQSTIAQINHLYNYFLRQEKISNPYHNHIILRVLNEELKSNSPSLPNIVGSIISIYLLKLNEENNRSTVVSIDNKNLDFFSHFKQLLEEHFSKTRDAKAYASELSISYKHLNEVCNEIANVTAKSFIDRYVILEAKRMLVSTSLSVKEIAFKLGFDEPTNFLKYFKKHTNITPVEFRNTLA
ncbi:helix-turn-helix transcriptional regulator [Mangrovibacterium sp.]|uniref:AraC family transcriptional regulator n=1 Tax=Mangrovibacterium sp. TaxID=1961364 RepID=UPI00356784C3